MANFMPPPRPGVLGPESRLEIAGDEIDLVLKGEKLEVAPGLAACEVEPDRETAIRRAITEAGPDDLIVVAGDNLFNQPLGAFGEFCRAKNAPVLGVYDVGSLDAVKKYCSIKLGATGQIEFFEEKPKQPFSTLIGIALYFYPKATLPLIKQD